MSRVFTRANEQRLHYAGAEITSGPLTMASWVKMSTLPTAAGDEYGTWSLNNGGNFDSIYHRIDDGTGNRSQMAVRNSALNLGTMPAGVEVHANTWHLVGGSVINDSDIFAASDGHFSARSTTTVSGRANPTETEIGVIAFSSRFDYFDGLMGPCAIWDVVLSPGEWHQMVADRIDPRYIRPGNLVHYIPMEGGDGQGETCAVSGAVFTHQATSGTIGRSVDRPTLFRSRQFYRLGIVPAAGGGVTGSGAAVLPAFTASGTAEREVTGTGAATLPAATASGTAEREVTGTGAATLPAVESSGTAEREVTGTGAATLPAIESTGTAEREVTGSGAATLPALSASGSGGTGITGTGAATLPAFEASGTAEVVTRARGGGGWLPTIYIRDDGTFRNEAGKDVDRFGNEIDTPETVVEAVESVAKEAPKAARVAAKRVLPAIRARDVEMLPTQRALSDLQRVLQEIERNSQVQAVAIERWLRDEANEAAAAAAMEDEDVSILLLMEAA